jgi:ribosomal-protein-alanine N-acetyltransferase
MEVRIRKWSEGDETELARHANNKKIFDNVRDLFPHPYTLEEAKKWIKFNTEIHPVENMAIVVDGRIAGSIGMMKMADIYRKNIEVGYFVGEEYWGKGIATAALQQYVDYVFRTFDATRICAPVIEDNKASQRVLEKAGFRKEARHIKSIYKNGQYHNEVVYALLKEEFH